MTSSSEHAAAPAAEVAVRLRRWGTEASVAARLAGHLSTARLVVFTVALGVTIWILRDHPRAWPLLPVPWLAFTALVLLHGRARGRRERAERAVAFYTRSADRLAERWGALPVPDDARPPPGHAYADDLDLLGPGSLFPLLSETRTGLGTDLLVRWLTSSASAGEMRARQGAVAELRAAVDLREELALLGDPAAGALAPGALRDWAGEPSPFGTTRAPLAAARVLAVLGPLAAAAWALDLGLWPLGLVVVADMLLGRLTARAVLAVTRRADAAGKALEVLAELLGRLERGSFQSPRLAALAASLAADGSPPSRHVVALARHLAVLEDSRRSPFFAPIAFLLQTRLRRAHAVDAWRSRHGQDVPRWLDAAAELEALAALSLYAWEHPDDVFPEIVDEGPLFDAEQLGHPLLPASRCVRNDLRLDRDCALLLVSGSNMSGKSTLLRSVGVAVVLATCGAPVRARRLCLSPLALGASIRIADSLQQGASHFQAEITRLAAIDALLEGELPVLFLLDEILQGTNSSDRLTGASAVITRFVEAGAVGLVTTHDLALTAIAERLAPRARNVHFEDTFADGRMVFDYRMRPGVVTRGNALQLMRALGLPV